MAERLAHDQEQHLADVHAVIVQQLLESGRSPHPELIAQLLQITSQDLSDRLNRLAELHGLVLHPHVAEPWIVHPFSTTPTLNFVEGENHGWWAPCLWCAFGIAQLAGGRIRIHSRLGAETEPLILEVEEGMPVTGSDIVVHFSIPPRNAWSNVHQHCSLVLPFRTEADVLAWCNKHGCSYGEAVPLETTAELARRWYGPYARSSWRKWSMEQAQQIFRDSGLNSAFWELSGKGTY
ncbi:alkylmercury lyase family protein [Granulicella arctica]|uniref:alkylmercury lyase family protein n=1 Tax=Granulicella arctica TaxID=940613 RepID=UPI0021E09774|nr:alkylmercury lyase family protein [Granulicella arctica]